MLEGLIVGITASLSAVGILKLLPEIRMQTSKVLKPNQKMESKALYESIATDLGYWLRKLEDKIFLLRLLPFELTPQLFKALNVAGYDKIMEHYKDAITKIIREGETAGCCDYWDASIFGICGHKDVDANTSFTINATYFPLEPDVMAPPETEGNYSSGAVNTSALALTREPLYKGILLIGKYSEQVTEGNTLFERIEKVAWKVGFSFDFNPKAENFTGQWLPKKCRRTVSKNKLEVLTQMWCDIWRSLPGSTPIVPQEDSRECFSVSINVDEMGPRRAMGWRNFIKKWYESEITND